MQRAGQAARADVVWLGGEAAAGLADLRVGEALQAGAAEWLVVRGWAGMILAAGGIGSLAWRIGGRAYGDGQAKGGETGNTGRGGTGGTVAPAKGGGGREHGKGRAAGEMLQQLGRGAWHWVLGRGEGAGGRTIEGGGGGAKARLGTRRRGQQARGGHRGGGGCRTWARWIVHMALLAMTAGAGDTPAALASAGAREPERNTATLTRQGEGRREGRGSGQGEDGEGGGGVRRSLDYGEETIEVPHDVCKIATLNVEGRMRLEGRDSAGQWGSGAAVEAEATQEWRNVESYMEGKALIVLTDVCMNGPQLQAAIARLEGAASGAWKCFGTKGSFCPADGRVRGGVLMIWDETSFTMVDKQVLLPGRILEATLQDRAGDMLTFIGAYMPTRHKIKRVVNEAWEVVHEAVSERPGCVVIGDLNAELADALERAGRVRAPYPTKADRWLQRVVDENALVSTGPEQATYEKGGLESQIDWILADQEVAVRIGAGRVEPGVSVHDHRALSVDYRPGGVTIHGEQRPVRPNLARLEESDWREIGEGALAAIEAAMAEAEARAGTQGLGPIARHEARQGALLQLVQDRLQKKEKQREAGLRGAGGKSKYERLRAKAAKWEGIRTKIEGAPATHEWFKGIQRRAGRRIWRVKELRAEALAGWRTPKERRERMLKIATYEAAVAQEEFMRTEASRGEGVLEELRAAVAEGGEGGITASLFNIVNKALRRESKAKGKKTRAVRKRPQVLLSALFENDDKEKGVVVTTARKVLAEVRRISERINRAGRSFPGIAREMMERLQPFPARVERDAQWVDKYVNFVAFEEALGKTTASVGVGVDGFPAYILRKMPEQVRRDYHADLASILRGDMAGGEYPEAWGSWVALLAMKPGEDARELGRRRDLWLAPHALKLITRCLTKEFDRAVYGAAPASNTGFTPGAGATAQTLTLKLHRARCRRDKKDYAVGFCDLGCYFMSVCRDVQRCAQEWAGVTPEVTDVMAALQHRIRGRSETAYGLTDYYKVERGIMQGCIGSPTRSLLQLRFMQAMVHDACQGYRFRKESGKGGGVPMVFYCDDGAFISESIAGIQMALDACWVAARVAGLDLRIKAKDAISRRGTKTAWMACYYDEEGQEQEVTGWDMYLPTGEKVPQVSQYTHLGVSIQAKWEGRHDEARKHVMKKCMQLLGLIARVEALGPQQVAQAMNLAVGGIIGYTGRSTPLGWAECNKIEAARMAALRRAGLAGGRRRAPIYLPEEAGGLGHVHSYQVAAAALMDEFERAINAGPGEPAKEAVEGALEAARVRLGVQGDMYEWLPKEAEVSGMDEDDEVEAWLICKARAQVTKRAGIGRRRERAGTGEGGRQGGVAGEGGAADMDGELGEGGGRDGGGAQDGLLRPPAGEPGQRQEDGAHARWEIGRARKTAKCMGGWEYELRPAGGGMGMGEWMRKKDLPGQVSASQLAEAREKRREGETRGGGVRTGDREQCR